MRALHHSLDLEVLVVTSDTQHPKATNEKERVTEAFFPSTRNHSKSTSVGVMVVSFGNHQHVFTNYSAGISLPWTLCLIPMQSNLSLNVVHAELHDGQANRSIPIIYSVFVHALSLGHDEYRKISARPLSILINMSAVSRVHFQLSTAISS